MKQKRIELIIFDLDGTLIDSLDDIADAANKALAETGLAQHPTAAYRYFVGNGLTTLIKRIVPAHTPEQVTMQVTELFEILYRQNWSRKTGPYSGIRPMIDWLVENEVRLNVLSNKPDAFTRLCVTHYFPNPPFQLVFGQREGVPLKPDPQAAIEIIEKNGSSPQASLFVGDTSVDIKTGKAAGMKTVGVTWGFRPTDELIAAGADIIISEPAELTAYVTHTD